VVIILGRLIKDSLLDIKRICFDQKSGHVKGDHCTSIHVLWMKRDQMNRDLDYNQK